MLQKSNIEISYVKPRPARNFSTNERVARPELAIRKAKKIPPAFQIGRAEVR
jgi:hypothetical protein